MYTWVVYWPSASATHVVVMTAEAHDNTDQQLPANGDFERSEALNVLDVKDWIGHQTASIPARNPGAILTRADGLKLYTENSGLLRVAVPQHLRENMTTTVHLDCNTSKTNLSFTVSDSATGGRECVARFARYCKDVHHAN